MPFLQKKSLIKFLDDFSLVLEVVSVFDLRHLKVK